MEKISLKSLKRRLSIIAVSFLVVVLAIVGAYFIQKQQAAIFSLREKVGALESDIFQSRKKANILDLRVGSLEEGMRNHVTTFNSRLSNFDARISRQERASNDLNYRVEEVASEVGSLSDRFLSSDARAEVDLGDITVGKR
jgi:cell division protein FtsL